MRTLAQLLVLVGGLVAVQLLGVPSGAAAGLACGASVTHDVTLHADLVGCTGGGLVVAADGVTVDLNGHLISGDGSGGPDRFDLGIAVEGRRDVTITGGAIRGFDAGVALVGSTHSRVSRLRADDNAHFGIALADTSTSRVTHVTTRRNTDVGVTVSGGSWNRLEWVTASDNEQGVSLDGTDRAVLTYSKLSRNADNVIVIGNRNRVVDNVIRDAVGCGAGCGGNGISLEAGSANLIAGNRVVRTVHDGIRLTDFVPDLATARNVVAHNVVVDAGNDGMAVATEGDDPVTGSRLRGNIVLRSGRDGIHVATPRATLTRNGAFANSRFGINAPRGVHDGGGNRAKGNGATPQCRNVTCH